MNAEMARQITELRHKGLGYNSIAIVVGTSRENVRYYCSHNCYIMDRFWSDDDKDRVVAKSPDRKTIKIAL